MQKFCQLGLTIEPCTIYNRIKGEEYENKSMGKDPAVYV